MDGASTAGSDSAQQRDPLVAEQATLRRLAMLVAGDVPAEELCRAITEEIGRFFGADFAAMGRYVTDDSVRMVAAWAAEGERPDLSGTWPLERVRELGIRSSAATPIVIAGRTWGILMVHSNTAALPSGTESRMAEFAQLVATAIASSEARTAARRLADEHAALRRVATLVARDTSAADVFAAVAQEVGRLLGMSVATVYRYEGDFAAVVASWGDPDALIEVGTRMPLEGDNIAVRVRRGMTSVRIDDSAEVTGPIGEQARRLGIRAGVGTPIMVDGRLWGGMVATSRRPDPLPPDAERRIAQFTELVATSIAKLEARSELDRVLAEQAALRRVATLVARETPPEAIFAAVAREVGDVLGVDATHLGRFDPDGTVVSLAQWGRYPGVPIGARYPLEGDSASARVLQTGRPARMDDYTHAPGVIAETLRQIGIRSSIGVPISVEGRSWGVMIATSKGARPFPPETESRLQKFTELVATAISNASAHSKVRALAEEQAALRRVATLVAQELPQAEVFGAIADEIGRLLAVNSIAMIRYDEGRSQVVVASAGSIADMIPTGTRVPLEGRNVASMVFDIRRAARIDDYSEATGPLADLLVAGGVRSVVGTPIMVSGQLWGAMMAVTHDAPLPPDTEARIGQFTELMATAIANAEARAEVTRLADEQAALRRVATLVAQGPDPSAVFDAVTTEVAKLLGVSAISLARYDDDKLQVLATRGMPYVRAGERYPLGGTNATSTVLRTGRPARIDDYSEATGRIGDVARGVAVRSVVAVPVVVDGRTWGCLAAIWAEGEPPPHGTEERVARFAALLDTAIANADSRDQLTASRARVLAAGDDARKRVVRDLHDGAQQRLLQTIITLKDAGQAIDEQRGSAKALVVEALDTAYQAMDEVRELAHGILPSVLTHGGLRAGVKALVSRLDLPVDVDVSSERLTPNIEASAYFIVAEALTNVVKHGRATRATVTATVDDGVLTLEVRDDGVGGANPEGHGLVGVADRVDALGGRLRIDSPDRGGTVLSARLPLSSPS